MCTISLPYNSHSQIEKNCMAIDCLTPGLWQFLRNVGIKHIMLFSTIVTFLQIKFILKCLFNLLVYFIGLLVIRNE